MERPVTHETHAAVTDIFHPFRTAAGNSWMPAGAPEIFRHRIRNQASKDTRPD